MKQLLFLFVVLSSFSMPPVLVDDKKNDWALEVNKPTLEQAKKVVSSTDWMAVYNIMLICESSGSYLYAYCYTPAVSYARWWNLEVWVTGTHAPYVTVPIHVPAGWQEFGVYPPINWACTNTPTGDYWVGLQ